MNRLTNIEIVDDGWPLLALAGVTTILVSVLALPVGCFFLGIMFWLAHVLRKPIRTTPLIEGVIVAPVDGRVVQITKCPANTSQMPLSHDSLRITIWTRITDTQLHTSPITGQLTDNCLFPGLFEAWEKIDDKDIIIPTNEWEDKRNCNERREITIRDANGNEVTFVQLGTPTARKLICRFSEGKHLLAGNPLGISCLGGVSDLYIPANSSCDIVVGQHVVGGETVIAMFASASSR